MSYVWGLWIYDRPGCRPELWSLHKTELNAEDAKELIGKKGFIARLPVN